MKTILADIKRMGHARWLLLMLVLVAASACAPPRSAGNQGAAASAAYAASSPGPPPTILPRDRSFEVPGFAFDVPTGFATGRFEQKPEPSWAWMNDALVLVEKPAAESVDVRSIPFGAVAAISVHPLRRGTTGWDLTRFVNPDREHLIGGHRVYPMPDLFGLGHHVYLMPLSDDSALMFLANCFHGNPFWTKAPPLATDYDRVIEQIIASARFTTLLTLSEP